MGEGQGGDRAARRGSGRAGRFVLLAASALALFLAAFLAALLWEPARTRVFNLVLALGGHQASAQEVLDRKSTRLNSSH